MKKIKKLPRYVFYGGAFGAALVVVALAGMTSPDTSFAAFFSQWTADTQASTEVRMYQQLSCADVAYDIAAVDMVFAGGTFTSPQDVSLTFGSLTGTGGWDKLKKRALGTSASVSVRDSEATVVTFVFNPPLEKETLCKSVDGTMFMTINRANTSAPHPLVYGSRNPNAYRSAMYGCVLENGSPCLGDLADMAFAFRTVPNRPPVIDAVSDHDVNVLDTLTFTLSATDPDGDTVRWGSSNLPDGATLDETAGKFTWTPTEEQVKDYKVSFIATDNGGPVEESSSVTLTITVHDVVTTPDMSQSLYENMLTYGLPVNTENSYSAHLKNLDSFITEGQTNAAINQLNALRGKIIQDFEQGILSEEQYSKLTQEVDTLLDTLNEE